MDFGNSGRESLAPAKSSSSSAVVRELSNPGNLKVLFHAGVFSAAVWLFSQAGDLLAM